MTGYDGLVARLQDEIDALHLEMADESERMTRERHETGMEMARLRLEGKLLRAQVDAVRALHIPYNRSRTAAADIVCKVDGRRHPCATIRALDGE